MIFLYHHYTYLLYELHKFFFILFLTYRSSFYYNITCITNSIISSKKKVFEIEIKIPSQYPFVPPKMKFITKIWHPNISSQTGAICLVSFDIMIMCVCIISISIIRRSISFFIFGSCVSDNVLF